MSAGLLAVTAVDAELAAVVRDLGPAGPCRVGPYDGVALRTAAGELVVVAGGVGMAAAAAAAATGLALLPGCAAVLCLGIAGGFDGRAAPGDVVVATEMVGADLGAWSPASPESPGGFLTLAELALGETVLPAGPGAAALAARAGGVAGPILTVAAVTGSDERAGELARRWGACAEAMEGFGVAVAARPYGRPVYEVRAISNACGRRDRAAWDVPGALDALSRASARLFAEELS